MLWKPWGETALLQPGEGNLPDDRLLPSGSCRDGRHTENRLKSSAAVLLHHNFSWMFSQRPPGSVVPNGRLAQRSEVHVKADIWCVIEGR